MDRRTRVLNVPCNYTARPYQARFLGAMDSGFTRACLVWHRRSGKSKTLLNFANKQAHQRIGVYYHAFPEYGQGRKIIWDGIDNESGKRLLDLHIPPEIRKRTNSTEMKIELNCGSIYQIIGADNYDSLVGPNPVGLIMDEWAVSDYYPSAWDYFRPILVENKGWAVFPYTPRGRNHGFSLYQMALRNPDWFTSLLTIDDTQCITPYDIQKERDSGMSEDMIQQEFYCSFVASVEDIVIPYEFILGAQGRDVSFAGLPKIAGLDPARFGDDRTALIIRQGGEIQYIDHWSKQDTVFSAGRIIDAFNAKMFNVIAVDVIGLGAGIVDHLKWAGVPTVPVNVGESPPTKIRFERLRDELWWNAREFFMDRACSISVGIPAKLREELVADIADVHYKFTPTGKIKVESKDEMKKRLGFSPDLGDALCLTMHHGVRMAMGVDVKAEREVQVVNWSRKRQPGQREEEYEEIRV